MELSRMEELIKTAEDVVITQSEKGETFYGIYTTGESTVEMLNVSQTVAELVVGQNKKISKLELRDLNGVSHDLFLIWR